MKKQKRNKKNHFDILSQVTFKPKKKRFVLISKLILKQKDSGKNCIKNTSKSTNSLSDHKKQYCKLHKKSHIAHHHR